MIEREKREFGKFQGKRFCGREMPEICSAQRPSARDLLDECPIGIEMYLLPWSVSERCKRGIDKTRGADLLAFDSRGDRVRFGPGE